MSDLLDTGMDWLNKGTNAISSLANAYGNIQLQQLQVQQAKNSIDVAKVQNATAADIARLNAQAQLAQAQQAARITGQGGTVFADNIASLVSRGNGLNNVMLILTVVGVGIAVLQYRKSRG